MPILETYFYT